MLAWTKLKICLYYDPHGGAGGRQMIRNYEWYKRSHDSSAPTNDLQFDILVTSYQIFVKDQAYFEKARISWRMLIVDEGHRLRNVKSKLLQTLRDVPADYRVLMTGTPLHNNVLELWSLLNFVSPGDFPEDEMDEFLNDFGAMKTEEEVTRLQHTIAPFMLR